MTKKVFEDQLIKIRDTIKEMYECPLKDGVCDCDNCACQIKYKSKWGEKKDRCVFIDLIELMERYDLMDDLPECEKDAGI